MWGMYEFFEFLDHNTTLLTLNIANNQLDEKCGKMLLEKMEINTTLTCLDFSSNNINITESLALQKIVQQNKKQHDEARKEEWVERKDMRSEDEK